MWGTYALTSSIPLIFRAPNLTGVSSTSHAPFHRHFVTAIRLGALQLQVNQLASKLFLFPLSPFYFFVRLFLLKCKNHV